VAEVKKLNDVYLLIFEKLRPILQCGLANGRMANAILPFRTALFCSSGRECGKEAPGRTRSRQTSREKPLDPGRIYYYKHGVLFSSIPGISPPRY
jgi:hypothetical protein